MSYSRRTVNPVDARTNNVMKHAQCRNAHKTVNIIYIKSKTTCHGQLVISNMTRFTLNGNLKDPH